MKKILFALMTILNLNCLSASTLDSKYLKYTVLNKIAAENNFIYDLENLLCIYHNLGIKIKQLKSIGLRNCLAFEVKLFDEPISKNSMCVYRLPIDQFQNKIIVVDTSKSLIYKISGFRNNEIRLLLSQQRSFYYLYATKRMIKNYFKDVYIEGVDDNKIKKEIRRYINDL